MVTRRKWRDLGGAVVMGCVATVMPLAGKPLLNSEFALFNAVGYVLALFALPGFWVGLLGGENIHGPNLWLIGAINCLFYTWLSYLVLKGRRRGREGPGQRNAQPERDQGTGRGG